MYESAQILQKPILEDWHFSGLACILDGKCRLKIVIGDRNHLTTYNYGIHAIPVLPC